MFANITWKKFFKTLGVLALMVGIGFAVKYGEDGQVGTENVLSKSIFIMAGFGVLYALGVLAVLLSRGKKGDGESAAAEQEGEGKPSCCEAKPADGEGKDGK